MLWLATLNPGGKTRKRKFAKRRKLSAWQRAVKRHGGVMQAVRAMRKRKKSSKKRRSVGIAKRLASRPRKNARRFVMAKVRSRRRRRYGARRRRNAWYGARRAHARASRLGWRRRHHRRRNPLYRATRATKPKSRKGQFAARGIRLSRIRGGGWHNNAVVPVSWNPRRRRYRRNSVLPISWNPGAAGGVIGGVLGRAQKFVDIGFWTDTALPVAGGFIGAKLAGGFVWGILGEQVFKVTTADTLGKVVRIGSDVLGTSILSWAVGNFIGKAMAEKVFLGGVVSVAHSVLQMLLGGTDIGRAVGLSGMGNDIADRMRAAVARRVQASLAGHMGTYLNINELQPQGMAGGRLGAYVNITDLASQAGYVGSPGADMRDYDVSRTETSF